MRDIDMSNIQQSAPTFLASAANVKNHAAQVDQKSQDMFSGFLKGIQDFLFNYRYVGKVYRDSPIGENNALIGGGIVSPLQPVSSGLTPAYVTRDQYIETKPLMNNDPNAVLECNNGRKINLDSSHNKQKFSGLCKP